MFFLTPLHFVTHTLVNSIPLMPYTSSLSSDGPYSSVLGIHFTTRVAPTTVRREHNNGISSVRVDTDKKSVPIKTEKPLIDLPSQREKVMFKTSQSKTLEIVDKMLANLDRKSVV